MSHFVEGWEHRELQTCLKNSTSHEVKFVERRAFEKEDILEYAHLAPLAGCGIVRMQNYHWRVWEIWLPQLFQKVINVFGPVALTADQDVWFH